MTKVSIILPIYNVAKYLPKCIDSVLNQTLKDIEVILATDGPEDCDKICTDYAKKDKRVKVISHPGGYGKSVNAGIRSAKGEYISIVECDDWCAPTMMEELYTEARYYDADVVKAGWFDAFDNPSKNKVRLFKYPNGFFNIYDHLEFLENQPSVWSGLYRKEFLLRKNIFFMEDKQSYVDAPFHYETLYAAKDYVLYNKPLYYYYQDNPNQSVKGGGKIYDGLNAEIFAYKKIIQSNLWDKVREGYINSLISHLDWNDKRLTDADENKLFRKAVKHFVSTLNLKGMKFSLLDDYKLNRLSFFYGKKLKRPVPLKKKKVFKLFNILTVFSVKYNEFSRHYYFCYLPLLTVKNKNKQIKFYLFQLFPILVVKEKEYL